jgi:hypothetical protein
MPPERNPNQDERYRAKPANARNLLYEMVVGMSVLSQI